LVCLGLSFSYRLVTVAFCKHHCAHSLPQPSVNLSHPPHPSIATDYLVPYLNNRAYPSMARHYPEDALATNPYFSPAVAGSLEYLSHAQRDSGLKIFVQYSSGELIYEDQKIFLQKMRSEGVEFEVDLVEGGAHLDAGLAFALLERGPSSSWVRLLDAVKRISA
jgi:acetyl esterase/lipase